ncbi:MAG: preprotein translocase subunit YajC [Synergistaceae bacterium]|nr:preprotein translocase subunit YajC [Synergistaceae bacterium]
MLHLQGLTGLLGGALPAYAAEGGAAPQQGSWMSILPFIVIMLGFFFFTSRSQKKKQKEHEKMLSSIAPGDTVISAGGFFGRVSDVLEDSFLIEIADGVRARILKTSITSRRDAAGGKQRPLKPRKKRRRPIGRPEAEAQNGEAPSEPSSQDTRPTSEVTTDESAALIDDPIKNGD